MREDSCLFTNRQATCPRGVMGCFGQSEVGMLRAVLRNGDGKGKLKG